MLAQVKSSNDTHNHVLMKGPNAWIEIPEIEFEIQAGGKRVIDTVYNFVAGAIFELTRHAAFVCVRRPCCAVLLRIFSIVPFLLHCPHIRHDADVHNVWLGFVLFVWLGSYPP